MASHCGEIYSGFFHAMKAKVAERKEVPLFDNKTFREVIINAVLHNKWVEGNGSEFDCIWTINKIW